MIFMVKEKKERSFWLDGWVSRNPVTGSAIIVGLLVVFVFTFNAFFWVNYDLQECQKEKVVLQSQNPCNSCPIRCDKCNWCKGDICVNWEQVKEILNSSVSHSQATEEERIEKLIREKAINDGFSENIECGRIEGTEYGWFCIDRNQAEPVRECVKWLCLYQYPSSFSEEYIVSKTWWYTEGDCESYGSAKLKESICVCYNDEPCAEGIE